MRMLSRLDYLVVVVSVLESSIQLEEKKRKENFIFISGYLKYYKWREIPKFIFFLKYLLLACSLYLLNIIFFLLSYEPLKKKKLIVVEERENGAHIQAD